MTRAEAKDKLAQVVHDWQGCKTTDLFRSREVIEIVCAEHHLIELIEELIQERRLVEVEYILSEWPGRVKSFLLPTGTTVVVSDRKEVLHG